MFFYRYTTSDGVTPLTHCPHCNNDLTETDSVLVILSVAETTVLFPTHLDKEGDLVDSDDEAIEKGFHSSTECNKCYFRLADDDNVIEFITKD